MYLIKLEQLSKTQDKATNSEVNGSAAQTPKSSGGQQTQAAVPPQRKAEESVNLNEIIKGLAVEDKLRQLKSLRAIISTYVFPNLQ